MSGSNNIAKNWAICKCFYEKNIYLHNLGHIKFQNREQFLQDYDSQLQESNITQILETINDEINRRRSIHPTKVANRQIIRESYEPLHKHLFNPDNIKLNEVSKNDIKEELPGVYSFPLLSKAICQEIMKEFAFFKNQGLPHQKPNSMNKNGILLEEFGILDGLLEKVVRHIEPLSKELYPDLIENEVGINSFKAFTVEYTGNENIVNPDIELGTHFDNCEVTLNLPLTSSEEDYEGSELYFEYKNGFKSLNMEVGRGILHSGRHLHGVMPIVEGYRHNIIIWMRSSEVRNKVCPMCNEVPVLEAVQGTTGDGFTM